MYTKTTTRSPKKRTNIAMNAKGPQPGFGHAGAKEALHVAFDSHCTPRSLGEIESRYQVKEYERLLNQIHPDFCKKLIQRAPAITPMELRVCILARAFVGIKESAQLLSISKSSIESHRSHARGKLSIENRAMSLISALHAV